MTSMFSELGFGEKIEHLTLTDTALRFSSRMRPVQTCEGLKECTSCHVQQPLTEFHAYKRSPDGKRTVCKTCRSAEARSPESREREREKHKKDPSKRRAAGRRYRAAHRDDVLAKCRVYYRENSEQLAEYQKRYREQNRERLRENDRQYGKAHRTERNAYERDRRKVKPEWEQSKRHTRRARKKAGGRFSSSEWRSLCSFYQHRCLACGRDDVKLSPDHVVPLCRGGSNVIENIQPLCVDCNVKKHRGSRDYRTVMPPWFKSIAAPPGVLGELARHAVDDLAAELVESEDASPEDEGEAA